ncbi:MAG: SCO family protein [Bacteroidia bacterium]
MTFVMSCSNNEKAPSLPFYNTPEFSPEFFRSELEAQSKITHRISKFSFLNQNGKRITDRDIEGKVHVANFIFTSCGSICPVLTKNMKMVQQAFKDNPNLVILSYSVTPWIDSVPVLKDYAQRNEITSRNWHLLTGSKDQIYTLARKSYFAEEDLGFTKDNSNFLHTEHVLLIDRKKRIRGIYNGTLQLENEQLVKDIGVLLEE